MTILFALLLTPDLPFGFAQGRLGLNSAAPFGAEARLRD